MVFSPFIAILSNAMNSFRVIFDYWLFNWAVLNKLIGTIFSISWLDICFPLELERRTQKLLLNFLFSERYLMILAIKTKPIHEKSRNSEERI